MVEEDPQGLYHKMVEINNHQRKIQYNSPFIIFDHCFEDDILNDTVSPEEQKFIKKYKTDYEFSLSPCCSVSCLICFFLTNISADLGVPIPTLTFVMIDVCSKIKPNNSICWTMLFC